MTDNDDDEDDYDNNDDDDDNDEDDLKPLNTSKRALNTNPPFFGTPCIYISKFVFIYINMYITCLLSQVENIFVRRLSSPRCIG